MLYQLKETSNKNNSPSNVSIEHSLTHPQPLSITFISHQIEKLPYRKLFRNKKSVRTNLPTQEKETSEELFSVSWAVANISRNALSIKNCVTSLKARSGEKKEENRPCPSSHWFLMLTM